MTQLIEDIAKANEKIFEILDVPSRAYSPGMIRKAFFAIIANAELIKSLAQERLDSLAEAEVKYGNKMPNGEQV